MLATVKEYHINKPVGILSFRSSDRGETPTSARLRLQGGP